MKTSNKILIIAILVGLAWLMVYDTALKAEYVKGDFRKPHYHTQQLNFSNFNAIEHNAGNIIGMQVEKGPYGVWVDDYAKDKVKITQHGQTLQIDYISKENFSDYRGITISCPDVTNITASAFTNPDKNNSDRYIHRNGNSMIIDYYQHGITTVIGFDQQAMRLKAGEFTEFELKNNTIGQLTAEIGDSKNGKASLIINPDNKIANADLRVPGKSSLTLDNVAIGKITTKMADSADIHLTGKAVHLLDKP